LAGLCATQSCPRGACLFIRVVSAIGEDISLDRRGRDGGRIAREMVDAYAGHYRLGRHFPAAFGAALTGFDTFLHLTDLPAIASAFLANFRALGAHVLMMRRV
jgi:hypothetical protein